MPQKIFQKFGTVRSENLSDIDNLTISLNNLLDKLVDGSSTYISEDLDCIRQLSTTSLDNDGFLRFANNEEVVLSPIDQLERPFSPNKTYQNRLDVIRSFTGEPRISGGNGLSAKYYDHTQIDLNKLNGDFGEEKVFNGEEVAKETGADQNTTWLNGDFNYNGRIQDAMTGFGGGVEWEGFFIPTVTGAHRFRTFSTGLYHMDWEADDYIENPGIPGPSGKTYVTAKRIGLENKVQVKVISQSIVALVNISDKKYIGLKLVGSGSNIKDTEGNLSETTIGAFDDSGENDGHITFDLAYVTGSVGDIFELTVKKVLGSEDEFSYLTPVLEKYRRYRIKFRLLFPEKDADNNPIPNVAQMAKVIDFEFDQPLSDMANIRYTRLYTLDYDFSDAQKGRMIKFIENSVLFGGGEIGEALSGGNGYVEVKSSKKVDIKYIPKTTLASIVKTSLNFDTLTNSNLITKRDTSGIEIGSKVFGLGIPIDTEVTEIVINQGLFMSNAFTSTIEQNPILIMEHRGFVKKVTGSTSGNTLSITGPGEDTSNLRIGMIVIGNDGSGDFPNYTKITEINSGANTVTLSSSKTTLSGVPITGQITSGGTAYIADGGASNGTRIGGGDGGGVTTSGGSGSGLRVNLVIVSGEVTKAVINTPGSGYAVGDVVTITNVNATKVKTLGPIFSAGSGYSSGNNVATTSSGSGTGLTVNTTVDGTGAITAVTINNEGSGYAVNEVITITGGSETAQFTVSAIHGNGATFTITSVGPFFFFYQGKGLINDSLIGYCLPAETRCLELTKSASPGNTVLFVKPGDNFDAVNTSWDAQGSAFDGGSSNITLKTTNTTLPDTDPEKFSITIEDALVKPIASGGNFTVTTQPPTESRILCCPPTDTSPPFEAIEAGLRTTGDDPKLRLSQGNLIFDNLTATNQTGGNISTLEFTDTASKSILIQTGVTAGDPTITNNQGTTFKILCST